jgi:hypothetical protein
VRDALSGLELAGPLAVVTAGWQEREAETEELERHVELPLVNLELYRRAEAVEREDSELAVALRERQRRLRRLQRLYQVRLDPTLDAVRRLLDRPDEDDLLDEARRAAFAALRSLDAEHEVRIREIHHRFEERWRPRERPAVVARRRRLRSIVGDCAALLIAGGHVAVLLNRLRLFGGVDLLEAAPAIVAWSAGAMALADRVVLFHDSPPQGAGNAELLDTGLGVAPGVLPLPDAYRRLRLGDPLRVALFARRFEPAICLALDEGRGARFTEDGWGPIGGVERLGTDGSVEPWGEEGAGT